MKDQDDEEDFEVWVDGEGEADEDAVEDDAELENDDAEDLCGGGVEDAPIGAIGHAVFSVTGAAVAVCLFHGLDLGPVRTMGAHFPQVMAMRICKVCAFSEYAPKRGGGSRTVALETDAGEFGRTPAKGGQLEEKYAKDASH